MKIICVLLCLVYITSAFKLFERSAPPRGWVRESRASSSQIIKFRCAFKLQNMDKLEAIVLAKSDPTSPTYGQHLSAQEITDLVAPPESEVQPVIEWLRHHRVRFTRGSDFIAAEATVAQVENLFSTEMYVYRHDNGKTRILNHGPIHIPNHLKDIIDLISGLAEFPYFKPLKIWPAERTFGYNNNTNYTDPGIIVPGLLQSIYNVPANFNINPNSSLCLAEFMDDSSFNDTDCDDFAQEMGIPKVVPSVIVGPYDGLDPDAESSLDVQYGGAMAIKSPVWFWTVEGWMYEFATDLQNASQVPLVVSMSWGWPEPWQCQPDIGGCNTTGWTSEEYVQRCNQEYIKIVARGITLVAASGDQGAPGDMNPDCSEDGTKKSLSNLFPASSPWVVAVGATMLAGNNSAKINYEQPPMCGLMPCATNGTEVVCSIPEALITTGGGFSSYSPRPSWQASYVEAYLNNSSVKLPPNKFFNCSNRGFPDVSALGHNYVIAWAGMFIQVDGTSCSSPVFGAMVSLLNSARLNAGKSSLGFITPLLYKAASRPGIYNDINVGNNKCTENCCSRYGFEATDGWDPVTGLGTPNFPALLKYVLDLP